MRRLANSWVFLAAVGLAGAGEPAVAIDLFDECREFRPIVVMSKQIERPKPPYCATSVISFFDEFQFQSCRSEMLEYQARVERYGKCLQQENSETGDELNRTIESFNRLASQ